MLNATANFTKRGRERCFCAKKFTQAVFRALISFSILFSTVFPAAAEMQYPAGTAADNPYDYVSSGTVTNPVDSGTEITAAALTENPYSTDTAQCNTDVNNGTYNLQYKQIQANNIFSYVLDIKTTNLKTNETITDRKNLGYNTEPRKLLNVYPSSSGKIGERLMSEIRSDGGHYYDDPNTGMQLFTFDSVDWGSFMSNPAAYMKNDDGSWKYDGIYFGAQDANGGRDISTSSGPIINEYIHDGFAVVVGHDVDLHQNDVLQEYYGYSTNVMGSRGTVAYVSDNSGTGAAGSSNSGNQLTTYPYKFNIGSALPIGESHTQRFLSTEKTNVWLTYSNSSRVSNGYYTDAYLFTSKAYPNVATSQAGHTTPQENDLKLIVNMLLYILSNKTKENSFRMQVKDIAAPTQPAVSGQKRIGKTNLLFNVAADDYATKFDFSLQATDVYTDTVKPAITMNDAAIKSGTTWYLYSVDTDENGTVSYTTNCLGLPVASGGTTMIEGGAADTLSISIPANARYLHIAAVDQAGNVSEVTTVEIPRTEDLTVQKVFEDFDNRYNLRPAEIIFDAFAGSETTSSGNCTANEGSEYSCTINDLLAYDANGDEVTYTVKERNTPNAYTASEPTIVIAQNKSITVTNTLVTQEIPVKKIWSDGNNQDGIRPESISFTLFCGDTECGDNPYTLSPTGNWEIMIPNIPVYDKEGEPYIYAVVESHE